MSKPIFFKFTIVILLFFTLASCNMPVSSSTTAQPPNAAQTAAAETIVAQITELYKPTTSTTEAEESSSSLTSSPTQAIDAEEAPTKTTSVDATPSITVTSILDSSPSLSPESEPTQMSLSTKSDPKENLGDATWKDTFATSENWPIYTDEHVEIEIINGRMHMTSLNIENWDSWMVSTPVIEDFYLEVTATPGECSGLDRYGLLARASGVSETYVYGFSCDGRYSLRIWDGYQFITLVDWTHSEYINAGADQTNHLGFMAQGSRISLYANGFLLSEIEDQTYTNGAFGLFIGSSETQGFMVEFSKISYWEIQ